MSSIIDIVQKEPFRSIYLVAERITRIIPDKEYLKLMYRIRVGKKLNLKDPKTLSEKLQWLKLYNRQPIYTKMVDKYEVKSIVAKKIGLDHVIPTIGVWDNFDEIDFKELPSQFVLKCTHDSGSMVICKDKTRFDSIQAKKNIQGSMKKNYFWGGREWPYKNIKRRIIAEPYIPTLGNVDSVEYKITCFNGKLAFSTICKGKAHHELKDRTNDFYDKDFNSLPFWTFYKHSAEPEKNKPKHLDEMIKYAEIIAEGIPYLRVDFYVHEDRILFGEATFFTWGGFLKFEPKEDNWDEILGSQMELPIVSNVNNS